MVDAKHFLGQLEQGDEAEEQVAFADVILLNKTDLVSADDLDEGRGQDQVDQPYARIHRTQKSQIELDAILDKGAFDLKRILEFEPDFLEHGHDHDHGDEVASLQLHRRPAGRSRQVPEMDGRAAAAARPATSCAARASWRSTARRKRYVFQGVHMMMDADWGTPWKDGEKRASKLVFIGRNLDGENLKRGFEDCLK